jgi:hypothetical protein
MPTCNASVKRSTTLSYQTVPAASDPWLRVNEMAPGSRNLPCGYEFMYGPGPGPSDRQRSCGVPRVPQPTLWVLIAPVPLPAAGLHAAEQ